MIELLVALNTASKPSSRQSGSVSSSRLKTRQAVHHRALEADAAAGGLAAAATRSQFQAIGPLLAVSTSMPSAEGLQKMAGGDRREVVLDQGELDEHIGAGGAHELGRRLGRLRRGRRFADRFEDGGRREAARRQQAAVSGADRADEHAQPVSVGEHVLLLREQRAEGARDAAEADEAEPDGARPCRARIRPAHRTDRASAETAATSRSSSPWVVYGASPARMRPPRPASPSNSTSRAA